MRNGRRKFSNKNSTTASLSRPVFVTARLENLAWCFESVCRTVNISAQNCEMLKFCRLFNFIMKRLAKFKLETLNLSQSNTIASTVITVCTHDHFVSNQHLIQVVLVVLNWSVLKWSPYSWHSIHHVVPQTSPVGVELFSLVNAFYFVAIILQRSGADALLH